MLWFRDGFPTLVAVSVFGMVMCIVVAYPHNRERRSGISDQRLAELETLMALSKMRGRGQPVAYGLIDPSKIGKRKRSYDSSYEESLVPDSSSSYLQQLAEELKERKLADRGAIPWTNPEAVAVALDLFARQRSTGFHTDEISP